MLVEIFMFNVSSCHKAKKGEISKTFATKFCKKTGYFHPLLETILELMLLITKISISDWSVQHSNAGTNIQL